MPQSKPNPLDLFLHAHMNGVREAERCLGVVERLLRGSFRDGKLLGCKSALLLIVQSDAGLAENDPLYRRKALQMAREALDRSGAATARQIRLINGLAWLRLGRSDPGRQHALCFLRVLEEPYQADRLPPLVALEGFVALSVAYQDQGKQTKSSDFFRKACTIDNVLANNRFEFFRKIAKRGWSGKSA